MSRAVALITHWIPYRSTILAALIGSLITFIFMAATRPASRTRFVNANETILPETPLDRKIEQFELKNESLRDAIAALGKQSGVAIELRLPSLSSAGVADLPVNVDLANVTAGRALDEILASVRTNVQLDYWRGNNVIVVGTLEEEKKTLLTRIFDVSELLKDFAAQGRDFWRLPDVPSGDLLNSSGSLSITYDEAENALIKIVSDNVACDTWKDNGGTIGAINCVFGRLIIVQTPRNQDAVEALLYRLSQPEALKPPPLGIMLPDHSLLQTTKP